MRSRPVLPVITGKTTTRKRSTRPAARSDRQRVKLPRVRIGLVPSCFIAATACTASPLISRVLGHDNGGCNAEENTIFDVLASSAMAAPSSVMGSRSEERRVGKECRCRWLGDYYKKNRKRNRSR